MELKGDAARSAMAWELVRLYGADGAREKCCGEMLAAVEAEIAAMRPERHCQNGRADICLAGFQDGVCCPDDSCDIDAGIRHVTPVTRAMTTLEQTAGASGVALTGLLGSTAQEVGRFIDPVWIKTSDWPANIIPAGAIAIDQASENGHCTVKGFYYPATGEFHIQEVLPNVKVTGAPPTDAGKGDEA